MTRARRVVLHVFADGSARSAGAAARVPKGAEREAVRASGRLLHRAHKSNARIGSIHGGVHPAVRICSTMRSTIRAAVRSPIHCGVRRAGIERSRIERAGIRTTAAVDGLHLAAVVRRRERSTGFCSVRALRRDALRDAGRFRSGRVRREFALGERHRLALAVHARLSVAARR